jgi:hypothetical protein
LEFVSPSSGELVRLEAALPDDLVAVLDRLGATERAGER